jgi:hypothetical protein
MKYLKYFEDRNKNVYQELLEDVKWVKEHFEDYNEIQDFFNDIEKHLYGNDADNQAQVGFGFCNESKSSFQPMFKDIAINLIENNFNININELEKTYKTLYFSSNIHAFRKYMEERPYKKYYYYKTIKKIIWGEKQFTEEEKVEYIKSYFEVHQISKNYNISVNTPASMITVKIVEK